MFSAPAPGKPASVTVLAVPLAHPRLFFGASEISALRAKAASTHNEIWTPIVDEATSQLGTVPPAQAPANGDLDTYRNFGNELIPFAFTCVITGATNYCDLAKTYLLTYATWGQWGEDNNRDLGLAHMLLGNAIAYDWLHNRLTPAERQAVRQSLAVWTQRMYEASAEPFRAEWSNWWGSAYLQNHNWIDNSALGMAGLALLGEDARSQMWVDQARNQMSRVQFILDGIGDGSWHEGIAYQSYGLTMALPFMVNLQRIQGSEIIPREYLRSYSNWRIYNEIPETTQSVFAFGDFEPSWSNSFRPQNLLRFIAKEYGDGHAEWMVRQLNAADDSSVSVWSAPWYVFEFLYYDPAVTSQPPTYPPKTQVFRDLEGIIWRTGWDSDSLIFGLKTGGFGGRFAFDTFTQETYPWEKPCATTGCQLNVGHEHDDANGFTIYQAERWLAPEVEGVGVRDSAEHNTLLIDGEGQYRPPENRHDQYPEDFIGSDGFLEATASSPDFDYVAADATRRYKNIAGLEDITRHVLFVRPGYFLMLDNLAAASPHLYQWVCHFRESDSIEGNWIRGNAGVGQVLGIGVASPQPFAVDTGNDGRPYIRLQPTSAVADVRFINVLYPTNDDAWGSRPTITTLGDSGKAVGVRVKMHDGSGRDDDVLLTYTYGPPFPPAVTGPYSFDARVSVISRGQDASVQRVFVYGGTLVKEQPSGAVLVANLDRNEPFEAVYSGETVSVYGNIRTQVTLSAPRAAHLTVNGVPETFARSGTYITFTDSSVRVYLPFASRR
ncbi:MAG: DUF4962 domain-containing protein [Chloroflexi bacterium]|nr:DUF4962 domain-containing protein [Chloroflexota bacterium]